MRLERPFHSGERAVHRRLGEESEARRNGKGISDSIVRGALPFIEQQPFVVLGTVDALGDGWASLLFGEPGFARTLDSRTVEVDLHRALRSGADPLLGNLRDDPRVGLLFIEPSSRRRLRVNGGARLEHGRLLVDVAEAYPNCPKYIQRRRLATNIAVPGDPRDETADDVGQGAELREHELALVRSSDTFFVSSSNPRGHVDVSHRGGNPGFVRVIDPRTFEIPDYPGNHMYNTFGNLVTHPRAGLVFLDFANGHLLQLTGAAEIVWERPGNESVTGGTNRFWRFRIDRWIGHWLPAKLTWELLEASPLDPPSRGSRRAGAR